MDWFSLWIDNGDGMADFDGLIGLMFDRVNGCGCL
jgi:hypothetical protein